MKIEYKTDYTAPEELNYCIEFDTEEYFLYISELSSDGHWLDQAEIEVYGLSNFISSLRNFIKLVEKEYPEMKEEIQAQKQALVEKQFMTPEDLFLQQMSSLTEAYLKAKNEEKIKNEAMEKAKEILETLK